MGTNAEWLDSLSPWPREGFGLERMRALLAELGDPQDAYLAIHVVGTNGKSTATVEIEQLLLSEGLSVGSTISPHVEGWHERIRVNGAEADFEAAVAPVRKPAERLRATQFETVTAAFQLCGPSPRSRARSATTRPSAAFKSTASRRGPFSPSSIEAFTPATGSLARRS